jgi:hypothetical protein
MKPLSPSMYSWRQARQKLNYVIIKLCCYNESEDYSIRKQAAEEEKALQARTVCKEEEGDLSPIQMLSISLAILQSDLLLCLAAYL